MSTPPHEYVKFWKQLGVVRRAFRSPDVYGQTDQLGRADDFVPDDAHHYLPIEIAVNLTPAGAPDYAYETGRVLVARDAADDVRTEISRAAHLGSAPIPNPLSGSAQAAAQAGDDVVVLPIGDRHVLETLDHVDEVLGEGYAGPNHILSICPVSLCPADEPVPARGTDGRPVPFVANPARGTGKVVQVIDTGLVTGFLTGHPWLVDVQGGPRLPTPPGIIPEYYGHGTFIAGVVRSMAGGATVHVSNHLRRAGAITEIDLRRALQNVLRRAPLPDIISLSAGGSTRVGRRSGKRQRHLGLQGVIEELRGMEKVLLVAAAGNDGSDVPFYPAAFADGGESVVSVGALAADGLHRACFTNYGDWVDVYAPGDKLINAFPHGTYTYLHAPKENCNSDLQTPAAGEQRVFDGMARWSGTSFSTPLVAGLIAARMWHANESSRKAAQHLLAVARAQAIPGVGPVLYPNTSIS